MRRFLILLFLALFGAVNAPLVNAQGGFTTVTGTITDPNGVKYACGTISAQLITAGGAAPTLNGGGFTTQTSPVALGCPTSPGTGASGSFAMRLADSGVIVPSNTTWRFTVNISGNPPPLGTGPQSFSFTSAINCGTNTPSTCTSNALDISSQLSALAPAIGNVGAVGPVNFQSLYPANPPFQILNNAYTLRVGAATFQAGIFTGPAVSPDQFTRFRLVSLTPPAGGTPGFVGGLLRGSLSTTLGPSYYYCVLDSTTGLTTDGMGTEVAFNLFRVRNNVNSGLLKQFPFPFVLPGDDFIIQVVGSTISVFQNLVLSPSTFTDGSPLTFGQPGIFIENDSAIVNSATNSIDNWSGGSIPAAYGAPFHRTTSLGTVTISQAQSFASGTPQQYQVVYTYTANSSGVAPAPGMRLVVSGFTSNPNDLITNNGTKIIVAATGTTSGTITCSPSGPLGTTVQAATGILQLISPD